MKQIDLSTQGIEYLESIAKGHADWLNMTYIENYYNYRLEIYKKTPPTEEELRDVIFSLGRMAELLRNQKDSESVKSLPDEEYFVYASNLSKWTEKYENLKKSAFEALEYLKHTSESQPIEPEEYKRPFLFYCLKLNTDENKLKFIENLKEAFEFSKKKQFAFLALILNNEKLVNNEILVEADYHEIINSLKEIFGEDKTGSDNNFRDWLYKHNHDEFSAANKKLYNININKVKDCIPL